MAESKKRDHSSTSFILTKLEPTAAQKQRELSPTSPSLNDLSAKCPHPAPMPVPDADFANVLSQCLNSSAQNKKKLPKS